MNFLLALKHAERGARIRRGAWSNNPKDDNYSADLVAYWDGRLLINNRNAYYSPGLTLLDYRAKDWRVVHYGEPMQ